MDKITEFFRTILKDRITDIKGERVRVIPKHLPESKIPCITIYNSGGTLISGSEKLLNINTTLPTTHPQYTPNKLYPQQFRRSTNSTNVQVNVWATTEQDRYHINEQIKILIWKLKSDHYTLCPYYLTGNCENLDTTCPATTINNHHTIKGQCPNPQANNYHSLFTTYNIIRSTFRNEPEFNQDELDKAQPLLRTIHNFRLDYYDYWNLGGNITTEYIFDNDEEITE